PLPRGVVTRCEPSEARYFCPERLSPDDLPARRTTMWFCVGLELAADASIYAEIRPQLEQGLSDARRSLAGERCTSWSAGASSTPRTGPHIPTRRRAPLPSAPQRAHGQRADASGTSIRLRS